VYEVKVHKRGARVQKWKCFSAGDPTWGDKKKEESPEKACIPPF
jgi:hypothetical protein